MQFPWISSSIPQYLGHTQYFLFLEPCKVVEFEGLPDGFPLELLDYIRDGTAAEVRQMRERTKRRLVFLMVTVMIITIVVLVYLF